MDRQNLTDKLNTQLTFNGEWTNTWGFAYSAPRTISTTTPTWGGFCWSLSLRDPLKPKAEVKEEEEEEEEEEEVWAGREVGVRG